MLTGEINYHLSLHFHENNDLENSLSRINLALTKSKTTHQRYLEAISMIQLGRVMSKRGSSISEAEKHVTQGISILSDLGLRPYMVQGKLVLGELYKHSGQRKLALENLKEAEALSKEMGMDYWLKKTQEVLETL